MNFAFITNAMTAIHEFGAKGFWQSLLVLTLVTAFGAISNQYLGAGNVVTTELNTLTVPVSPTVVVTPTTVQ